MNAYNESNTLLGELMRNQLTLDQLMVDCVAPLKLSHHFATGEQLGAALLLT
ncbi:hypothetical protein [Pseudomonas sp. K2I15]|uniref:hypothetical protein n=1 Tax=Pseudomonas sp. K2I15 TaxID=2013577 RepID=UPI0015962833|nr:hypothetical protein [Pseudomonas sp. K2I15]